MTAYHWTSAENIVEILREGLRPGSWVCLRPKDAHGEVLFEVECNLDWDKGEDGDRWQRILPDGCPPNHLRLLHIVNGRVEGNDVSHQRALKRADLANER